MFRWAFLLSTLSCSASGMRVRVASTQSASLEGQRRDGSAPRFVFFRENRCALGNMGEMNDVDVASCAAKCWDTSPCGFFTYDNGAKRCEYFDNHRGCPRDNFHPTFGRNITSYKLLLDYDFGAKAFEGQSLCPDGFFRIERESQCKEAAVRLGERFRTWSRCDRPAGCVFSSFGGVGFNSDNTDPPMERFSSSRVVCVEEAMKHWTLDMWASEDGPEGYGPWLISSPCFAPELSGVITEQVITCQVDPKDKFCFLSNNFPQHYGDNERCVIQVPASLLSPRGSRMVTEAFNTESNFDSLRINGFTFSGRTVPEPVEIPQGIDLNFTWTSDLSATRSGWRVCFEELGAR